MITESIANQKFGLLVRDLDCADVGPADVSTLRALLLEHQVLVIPGQLHLTPRQEVAFYRVVNPDCHSVWRDQENNPWEKYKVEQGNLAGTYQIPDEPGVLVLGKGDIDHFGLKVTLGGNRRAYGEEEGSQVLGGGALQWHIDGTFYEHHPCRMTQMRCVEAPTGEGHWIDYNDGSGDRLWCAAGATAFASGRIAFDYLSSETRRICFNTRVHYASEPFQETMHLGNSENGLRVLDDRETEREHGGDNPPVNSDPVAKTYPLIWTCEQTGSQALMPHPRCLCSLENDLDQPPSRLGLAASRSRVEALMRPAISPPNVYVHNWKAGDLVLWNNHAVWHSATGNLSDNDRRIMHLTAYSASRPPVCIN